MASQPDRVAVLMVRAWREDEGAGELRARITWVDDVRGGVETSTAAAGGEAVLAVVRRWLAGVAAGDP